MRREVQVHFENAGQISWHEDIEDPFQYLDEMSDHTHIAHDEETGRYYRFPISKVTAIIVSEPKNKTVDPWERTYQLVGDRT